MPRKRVSPLGKVMLLLGRSSSVVEEASTTGTQTGKRTVAFSGYHTGHTVGSWGSAKRVCPVAELGPVRATISSSPKGFEAFVRVPISRQIVLTHASMFCFSGKSTLYCQAGPAQQEKERCYRKAIMCTVRAFAPLFICPLTVRTRRGFLISCDEDNY